MSPILMMTPDTSATFTATVVIAGISIVVGVLLLLILVFNIFGMIAPKINDMGKNREAKKEEKKAAKSAVKAQEKASAPAPAPAPVQAPAPVVESGIPGEVVAVIAAAVAASEGPTAVVRAIKKSSVTGRNPWAQAAAIDNTRPF